MSRVPGSNGTGPVSCTVDKRRDMELWDSLPEAVRRAASEAVFCYASADLLCACAGHPPDVVAGFVPRMDEALLKRELVEGRSPWRV